MLGAGPDEEVDVVRICICEQIRCGMAMAIFVKQGAADLWAEEVLVRCTIVGVTPASSNASRAAVCFRRKPSTTVKF